MKFVILCSYWRKVASDVADHGAGRPGQGGVEEGALEVRCRVPDVVEAVEVRDVGHHGQVTEGHDSEDDSELKRRGAARHDMGFSASHSSHHSMVEYSRCSVRHGVQPP